MAVGGESSGGNLAAAAAIFFKSDKEFKLSHQFLITSVMDFSFETMSYKANFELNLMTEKMKWFWNHYLNDPAEGSEIPVSPLKLPCVKHLPETLLVIAEFDPLRDEGLAFGKRLKEAGVKVELLHVDRAKQALEEMTTRLRELIHS